MKGFKKLGVALLSATLLLSPYISTVKAQENPYDTWKTTALQSPQKGQLVAAGDIKITWNPLNDSVKRYDLYFDGEFIKSVDANTTQTSIYTTKVSSHTVRVVAVLENEDEINVSERTFYVSKKGMGFYEEDETNSLRYTQNMGVSWYYNWSEEAYDDQDSANSNLEFVPMIWNDVGNVSERLKNIKDEGYDKVLSFNEPDYDQEANMSVDLAADYNDVFHSSGLRVGSPAVSEFAVKENGWFENYWNQLNTKDDFIAIHNYPGYIGLENAEDGYTPKVAAQNFLNYITEVYDHYQKPIWITEFAVAAWDSNEYWHPYDGNQNEHNEAVQEFMDYVINGFDDIQGLDELPFVERYAWFSFDATQFQAGSSALFYNTTDTDNLNQLGTLTDLGNIYRNDCGNPQGYTLLHLDGSIDETQIVDDLYIEDDLKNQQPIENKDNQIQTIQNTNTQKENNTESIATGDQTNVIPYLMMLLTSCLGYIYLTKIKQA